MVQYVIVTGGVVSGLGKGVLASSTGVLLRAMGFVVTSVKIDPYLNVDAGTMSPFEHGEVFVLNDGGEADLDLGNYERFVDIQLSRDNNITTGKIYNSVIEKERRGDYLGKTVQVVPHITNEIQDWIEKVGTRPIKQGNSPNFSISSNHPVIPDICIIEVGGTVGDIEGMSFIEALRQFQFRVGKENICFIHVSLVPVIGVVGEQKTKPTQQSVRELRALGLAPDLIVCRSERPLHDEVKLKISQFCHVPMEDVITCHNVSNIYHVPLLLHNQQFESRILQRLKLRLPRSNLKNWNAMAALYDSLQAREEAVKIALVGKYTGLSDSYLSVLKAVIHSALFIQEKWEIVWIDATHLENVKEDDIQKKEEHDTAWQQLKSVHGILVCGGFGERGVEGKILASNYARCNSIPQLGICLGLHVAVIDIARNILGWKNANSEEFDTKCEPKVIIFMPEGSKTVKGGTMRLGERKTIFKTRKCKSIELYAEMQETTTDKLDYIAERHRHRYEVNPELIAEIEAKTPVRFVGHDEDKVRMEIMELEDHPFFVCCQYHPEFLSRPGVPSPLFVGLLRAANQLRLAQQNAN